MAEDDRRQAEVLRHCLQAAGHAVAVVHDGRSALAQARRQPPDLLILDLMMPELNGLEVCRALRRDSDVMVLMLTARTSEDDMLIGLDVGADDYLTKPYSPRELVARVRTLLRRRHTGLPPTGRMTSVGRLVVDPGRHHVEYAGTPVDCTPGEFAILAALAGRPDQVFTRAQLLAHTKGIERHSTERTVDVHVMNLRRKLTPELLVTVYGVGYKLSRDAA
ncbi:response regulator transcription factor [Winogradskya consettensis]|uniref:DNA-binding response regulator n=1 Tax=Winogradskya consettensis TaxID=113560 RepID=A0A919STV8_9ACTN|nr:DNA-binding response regulator [Actinoplanes consettensis]